jgi:hypothetical protein
VNSLWECGHVSPYAIDRIRGYLQIKHRLRNAWVGNQNGSLLIATGVTVPRGHGAPVFVEVFHDGLDGVSDVRHKVQI